MSNVTSVIPFFLNEAKNGKLPITDEAMTRFNITLKEGTDMVIWALKNSFGSEIFVPKIPSYRVTDLAEAIGPNCKKEIIGIRPGEKLHELMITKSDSPSTIDLGNYFAILPSKHDDIKKYEPLIALNGGNDGLDVIKKVIYKAKYILKINGTLAIEIGNEQYKKVSSILKRNNFRIKYYIKDYKENIRCLISNLIK